MSRVGKMPVAVPQGVDVAINAETIDVKGAGGKLSAAASRLVKVELKDGKLSFVPADESREANAMSGTLRQLVSNMVIGVSKGFEKKLSLIGVGYKASVQGNKLNLNVVLTNTGDSAFCIPLCWDTSFSTSSVKTFLSRCP